MYSSITVANCFLDLAERDGEVLTPMKIQKLVYIAQGWHLGLYGKPLISEEVEAWQYGPVFPELYHEFKLYGGRAIVRPSDMGVGLSSIKAKTRRFLKTVWKVYRQYTAVQLSNLTHKAGTPWYQTEFRRVIEERLIQNYYARLADQED
jgi:uncharacterized phage-associated protein